MNYMNYLMQRNQVGQPGLRMPSPTYGNGLGMSMPSPSYGDGLGIKPPASFGDVSGASGGLPFDPKALMSLFEDSGEQQQLIQPMQIPSGSNVSYEELMKMYGVQGLLG
jgi:hypothetical protein